jgi:multidrug efflux system outer membrane protein
MNKPNAMKKYTSSLVLLCLTSCKPLPEPMSRDTLLPHATRNGTPIVYEHRTLGTVYWWKKMHDPSLNHMLTQALSVNYQLETARANLRQAEANLKAAKLAWLPTLNATGTGFVGGGWDSSYTLVNPSLNTITPQTTRNNLNFHGYYSGFVPSYSVNILANLSATKFAQASRDSQRAAYLAARLSIVSQVSGSYFTLLGLNQQYQEQSDLLNDLKTVRELEWVRYQSGASDLSTVTSLDEQISQQQASIRNIENSRAQIENTLHVLLNQNPGPIFSKNTIHQLSIKGLIPRNLPSDVLKNRPDIIMATQNLKMTSASLGIAYASFFPTISLTNLIGGASVELSHLVNLSTGLWAAELIASVPIINGSNYQKIKAAREGYMSAFYAYLGSLKTALADVDNSLTQQQILNRILYDNLKAYKASQMLFKITASRYRNGAADYRSYLNTKISLDKAKLNLTLAKMQQLDGIVQVYQALAGGNMPRPCPSSLP